MSREEIKAFAKEILHANFWPILGTVIVAGIITSFSIIYGKYVDPETGYQAYKSISLGWIFYFVNVGLVYYMVKLINHDGPQFKDIFHFGNDFFRCLGANLLQSLFVILWSLLLIVPGIIKSLGYALVPYLLADEKYKDMKVSEILKKSQEMMNGHKADYFVFGLSFILWWLLGIVTCGIAFIYVSPYQQIATTKFLNDIKVEAEGGNTNTKETTSKAKTVKYCPQCGKEVKSKAEFCSECGTKL